MDAIKQYEIYVSFYGKQAFCFLGSLVKYEWKCHNQFTCQQFEKTILINFLTEVNQERYLLEQRKLHICMKWIVIEICFCFQCKFHKSVSLIWFEDILCMFYRDIGQEQVSCIL